MNRICTMLEAEFPEMYSTSTHSSTISPLIIARYPKLGVVDCVGTQIRMDFLLYSIFRESLYSGCFLLARGLAHGFSHRAGSTT